MRKRGPRRTPGQRERDLVLISELYLKGETQEAISQAVTAAAGYDPPITRRQMGFDIQKLHKRWLESQLINIDEAKARELARIDALEREAWAAWERSQQDAETQRRVKRTGGRAPGDQIYLETKGQVGDAAFLRIVQWCVEMRCQILGLKAPERQDITSDGKPLPRCDYIEVVLDRRNADNDLGENQPA